MTVTVFYQIIIPKPAPSLRELRKLLPGVEFLHYERHKHWRNFYAELDDQSRVLLRLAYPHATIFDWRDALTPPIEEAPIGASFSG